MQRLVSISEENQLGTRRIKLGSYAAIVVSNIKFMSAKQKEVPIDIFVVVGVHISIKPP